MKQQRRVDVISLQQAGAFDLWRDYVSQRKPVVIDGLPGDWAKYLTDDALIREAGNARVKVEVRDSPRGAYGLGQKVPMLFGEFVKRVAAGDTGFYLTAQQVSVGPDGHAELTAPPVTQLLAHLPLQPALLPHLVPQSINTWMGAAPNGSSSGLHHDFHDNLYVLLRGRKRFRLYPPSQAGRMYTVGRPVRVHANGRIVYDGQGDVAADGSDAREVARWRARSSAEAAVAAAEAAAARGDPGAAAALEAAETRLEAALEGALGDGGADSDAFDDLSGDDDYNDEDESLGDSSGDDDPPSGGDAGGGARRAFLSGKKGKKGPTAAAAANGKKGAPEPPPPSFSRVDLSLSPAELAARFPKFPGTAAAVVAEVSAGQCLFLPAGCATHLALNWWFHPPDNLAPTKAAFRAPYSSNYWPTLWSARRARLEAALGTGAGPNGSNGLVKAGDVKKKRQRQEEGAEEEEARQQNGLVAKQQQQSAWLQGELQQNGVARETKQHKQKQRKVAIGLAPRGGGILKRRSGSSSKQQRRQRPPLRIKWPASVRDVKNRYYQGMTHPGTASGTAAAWPPPRKRGDPPGGGSARSSSKQGGEEERQDDSDSEEEDEEAAAAASPEDAVAALFKSRPEALRALFAQFMAARGLGGGAGRRSGGGLRRVAVSPLAAGRRHHLAVAYRMRKRQPKPQPPGA